MENKTIYLRIDVDFNVGLKKGVPFILDVLRGTGSSGTFFVVMGPDTLHRHISRIRESSYKKRLMSFNPLKLVRYFGVALMRSRLLDENVGPSCPDILRDIAARGHEIGIHGFNHADWAESCFEFSQTETQDQIDQAIRIFNEILPGGNWIWGAPNWKCNAFMLDYIEKRGVRYSSDVRGCKPFYPQVDGKKYKMVQFPVNLPCLHELVQLGIPRSKIASVLYGCLDGSYNLLCIHAYYEGLLERAIFSSVLRFLMDKGYWFKPLRDAYKNLKYFEIPVSQIATVRVPGGTMDVSCQKEFLKNNYFRFL